MTGARIPIVDPVDAAPRGGHVLVDHFRCPPDMVGVPVISNASGKEGYFRLGSSICYGQCSSAVPVPRIEDPLPDVRSPGINGSRIAALPFDPAQVIDNLRFERYNNCCPGVKRILPKYRILQGMYSAARPLLPASARRGLQRLFFRGWEKIPFPRWPVDSTVENIRAEVLAIAMKAFGVERVPFIWFWPDGARSCTVMTHDVETSVGRDHCFDLMDLDESFGIKSSFQIVPEGRYAVPHSLLESMRARGFEVNIHDLNHDGRLVCDRKEFQSRARRINHYARRFRAGGFRSAVMYRNLDWYDVLDVSYDMSVPNVAHLDPQHGGCCTVFPFFIGRVLELPLTTTQDYTLFHILKDYSINLWKEQISLISQQHGLISFIAHPDYIIHRAARRAYTDLLEYLCELRSEGKTWFGLPNEVNAWWRLRQKMSVVKTGTSWRITGKGNDRARLAYAVFEGGGLRYELAGQ
jgi:hypothetical protein